MNGIPSRAVLAVLLCVFALGCAQNDSPPPSTEEPKFTVEGELRFIGEDGALIARIAIELAETQEEQSTGLMGRRSLPALGGMLFVNDEPRMQHFWMKNTPLPLDIIFIRDDLTITNIVKRTRPLSSDFIDSTEEAQYVLEVRGGFTDQYGIDESARVEWRRLEANELSS